MNQYKVELQYQHVSSIHVEGNKIEFVNAAYNFLPRNYGNQFNKFSKGRIEIEETDKEYIIKLQADTSPLLTLPGVFAVLVLVLFSINGGLNAGVLLFSLVAFLLVFIPQTISLYLFFPVYFTRVRNDIESRLLPVDSKR